MSKMRNTKTKYILHTGSYDAHKELKNVDMFKKEKLAKLEYFIKGSKAVITVLSCGLVDKSQNIEKKLMGLANKISRQKGIKVLVRLKTRYEMPKYDKFYDKFIKGNKSILLTGAEYALTDFLPVTKLFIASISNSGFDVVMREGRVIFVDFLNYWILV